MGLETSTARIHAWFALCSTARRTESCRQRGRQTPPSGRAATRQCPAPLPHRVQPVNSHENGPRATRRKRAAKTAPAADKFTVPGGNVENTSTATPRPASCSNARIPDDGPDGCTRDPDAGGASREGDDLSKQSVAGGTTTPNDTAADARSSPPPSSSGSEWESEGPDVLEQAEQLLQAGDAAAAFALLSGHLAAADDDCLVDPDALTLRASAALVLGDAAQALQVRAFVVRASLQTQLLEVGTTSDPLPWHARCTPMQDASRACAQRPLSTAPLRSAAAAAELLGRPLEACEFLSRLLRLEPDDSVAAAKVAALKADMAASACLSVLEGHTDSIHAAAVSPCGTMVRGSGTPRHIIAGA